MEIVPGNYRFWVWTGLNAFGEVTTAFLFFPLWYDLVVLLLRCFGNWRFWEGVWRKSRSKLSGGAGEMGYDGSLRER